MKIIIDERIHELMDTYSEEIANNDFSFFFEELKTSIIELAEEYVTETYNNHYGLFVDIEQQMAFSDATNGYKAQMDKYIKEHQISLVYQSINVNDIDTKFEIPQKAIYVATGGTIIAVAFCFAANVWIGMLTEIIVLGYAYKVYSETKKHAQAIQMQQIVTEKKEEFINQILNDVCEWNKNLSDMSDKVLRSFNFNI